MKKNTAKEVKMHKYLVCACKSQDFAQSQKFFAWSHDRVTVTFNNSELPLLTATPCIVCGARSQDPLSLAE